MSAAHLRDVSPLAHRPSDSGLVPRHDLDAESAVLSACMLEPRAYALCLPHLHESGAAFYSPANRRVWEAIVYLAGRADPVDAVTVGAQLKQTGRLADVGGVPYLASLVDAVPSVANVEAYARIVAELYLVRELGARCQRVAAESYQPTGDPVGWVAQSVAYLGEVDRARPGTESASAGDIARGIYERLEEPDEGPGAWLSTGLPTLDRALGGLLPGDIVVLAAYPSIGKSSLARRIALGCANAGRRAAIFSSEMPKGQITRCLLTTLARIDGRRWRQPGEVRKVEMTAATQWLIDHPVLVYDALRTPADVSAQCKSLKASKQGLDLAIIDFVQAFQPSRDAGGNREQAVAGMMADFARIAGPQGALVPTIILSAVNKPSDRDTMPPPPTERDLRDTGMIASWATAIVIVHRENHYNLKLTDKSGYADIYIPKSRLGPTGHAQLWFDAPTATFHELESER